MDCFVASAPRNDGGEPGIGFEGKSDLYKEMQALAA
jgi:hypothetical protein